MRFRMIRLLPIWMESYEEFWEFIRSRNLFLIKLRYGTVALLFAFNFLLEEVIDLYFSDEQHQIILYLILFLLIYNILIHYSRRYLKTVPKTFNPLHLSLVQIVIDLTTLMILIYITGGIESPLKLLLIFHIIVGSLILPGYVIYIITSLTFVSITAISFLEYHAYIPHFAFGGLYETPLYDNPQYVLMRLIVFCLMMFISAFITNRIAHQLYAQEKHLIEALDEINKSEIKKQKYIMGVVHEIKSPIAATKSLLILVLEGYVGEVSPQVKEKLGRAMIRTTESLGMINNILRISSLRLFAENSSEDVDIYNVVTELLKENNDRLNEKSIKVVKESKGIRKRIIKGDKFLLQLAISNIISNAVKYTNDKGQIWISLKYSNEFIELSICDDGIGIEKSDLKKIFKNYYRAKNIQTEYQEGAGVGLSLVKEIIIQHRGEISATSPSPIGNDKRPGTCFNIKLPYSFEEIDKIKKEPPAVRGAY